MPKIWSSPKPPLPGGVIVLVPERRPRVFFYTSNADKYLQARYVFAQYGYILEHYESHTQPYAEEYAQGKEYLLAKAVDTVRNLVGRQTLFFLEDTSLRIEALSSADVDVPGLSVKEWFVETSFEQLDAMLRAKGDNRRAIIKSGIALSLPGKTTPVYFNGETAGTVALSPPGFERSRIHPWLSPTTFDGWFVPDGNQRRLGEMKADESQRLHFRARALIKLLERLGEYTAVLNLQPPAYVVRRSTPTVPQLPLFRDPRRHVVVVGPRAAGKSTFGDYVASDKHIPHREASLVIRALFRDQATDDVDLGRFAENLHIQQGQDVVAHVLVHQYGLGELRDAVVTGLRKFEELDYLEGLSSRPTVIFVTASRRTRFERYVARRREDKLVGYEDFVSTSDEEEFFKFVSEYADVIIENEGTLPDYFRQIDYVMNGCDGERPRGVTIQQGRPVRADRDQLYRCLAILHRHGGGLTNRQISDITAATGRRIATRNVNKVLGGAPSFCTQVRRAGQEIENVPTERGKCYVRLVDAYIARPVMAAFGSMRANREVRALPRVDLP